ncbi:NPCBM/NEW2 domain-containing protein, partial [Parabacteroides distasonis]
SYGETIPEQTECVPYLTPYQTTNLYSLEETEDTLDCFYVMGKAYYKGVIPDNYQSTREALYNLGQKYNSVTFTVGHHDNERTGSAVLRVFGDGNLMKELELTRDMMNQTVTINTVGVTQMKISYEGSDSNYAIFDMSYESVETWEHNFTKEVLLEATVGQTGICTYTCVNCGACYTEIIPAVDD